MRPKPLIGIVKGWSYLTSDTGELLNRSGFVTTPAIDRGDRARILRWFVNLANDYGAALD